MIPALVCVALLAAPSGDTAKAEALTRRAIVEFDAGELDAAFADIERAYALRPVPGLLYDLGQVHRALHHWQEAASALRSFLRVLPQAQNRAAIEALIKELDERQRRKVAGERQSAPSPTIVLVMPQPSELPVEPPPAPLKAKPRLARIAVLDIRPHGAASQDIAQAVTSIAVLEVRKRAPGAVVVGADEIRTMIGLEHEKQLLGCSEGSCLAEIGGALGAERLVLGSLSRYGDYLLDLTLLDARTGKALAEGSARFKRDSELLDAVAQSVAGLFPKPTATGTPPVPAAALEAPPPEAKHHLPAAFWALGTAGLAAGIGGAVAYVLGANDLSGYTGSGRQTISYPQYQTGNGLELAGEIAVPVGVALLATGIGFALFGSSPAPSP